MAQKLTHGARPPLINAPKAVSRTRRDDVANNLANIENVRTPKVLLVKFPTLERITALVETRGFQFPAIVRQAGKHTGEILGIFESPAELSAIFGDRRHEYYLTEYVDIRRSDGLYRKTRFFFIGDQIVMRHHLVADQWSIHGGDWAYMAEHESLMAESRSLMDGGFEALAPQTQAALQAIRVRIGLEFCGLDCCLMEDGSVVVFECNATMNFNPDLFDAPGTQHNRSCLPRALSAMRRLIEAKTGKTLQRPTPA